MICVFLFHGGHLINKGNFGEKMKINEKNI